ncbi:Uncharacterised protein [Segatella copri]|nr:Uncharacterised protein [Segatella copri]
MLYRLLLFPLRRFAHKAPKRKGMPLGLPGERKLDAYELMTCQDCLSGH